MAANGGQLALISHAKNVKQWCDPKDWHKSKQGHAVMELNQHRKGGGEGEVNGPGWMMSADNAAAGILDGWMDG